MGRRALTAAAALALLLGGYAAGKFLALDLPCVSFETVEPAWSIAIYAGPDPLSLAPHPLAAVPALTAKDVTDVEADFVADPFLIRHESRWHMFFEVLTRATGQGDIGYASSADGIEWSYGGIVLDEPFHLSFPYVFAWEGEIYMVPESHEALEVRLYRAAPFPRKWEHVATLLAGRHFVDCAVLRHAERWWLFAGTHDDRYDLMDAYFAERLEGPYRPHPLNPLVRKDPSLGRRGGRTFLHAGRILSYVQDCSRRYGERVRVMQFMELTPTSFKAEELPMDPVLGPSGMGWNGEGMHHVDAHLLPDGTWLAAVDGINGRERKLRFRLPWK